MDSFYKQFPFASYKVHQLWVQSILDEERETEERSFEDELNKTIQSPRSVIQVVAPSKHIDSVPSDAKNTQSDSKSFYDQKTAPLTRDATKVNSQKPKKKLKYTRDELMRIDQYQGCPFTSYDYHQEWAKDLIKKEQNDKDKRSVTEELGIGKRKRQDKDDLSEIHRSRSRYIAPMQSLPRSASNNNRAPRSSYQRNNQRR